MFKSLSERLNTVVKNLSGQGRITEENIKTITSDIRMALIEADVAIDVIGDFIAKVKERAIGDEVANSISPGQAFVKIVQDELTEVLGAEASELNLEAQPPVVILMAGLQGSGKTTTAAKLALWLKEVKNKTVMVASADVYRPAAIKQLETLAKEVDAKYFPSDESQKPVDITKNAMKAAKKEYADVLIIDTAGRLHVDEELMGEIKQIHKVAEPTETLFVVDSMTGQDAANTAKAFNDALALTGVVLTKTDGDARGGAALSIRHITQKPIKFIGVGEKIDALEAFHPDRIASRILGMGDIVSLVEEAKRKVDSKQAEKAAKKVMKGKFDLSDYQAQIKQMDKMGGISKMLTKIPGLPNVPDGAMDKIKNNDVFSKHDALINSMTPQERLHPAIIKGSRRKRIAAGAGMEVQELNRLLKQFDKMAKMMKKLSKGGGMAKMMKQMQGMMPPGGGMPGGNPFQ